MFRSGSPYSSFFMSGFQHVSNTPTPTSAAFPAFPIEENDWFVPDFRRRGSLPTGESASLEKRLSVRKPKSTRERSWLSLDLANQQTSASTRSMPLPKPVPFGCLPALPTVEEEVPSSPTPSSVLMPVSPPTFTKTDSNTSSFDNSVLKTTGRVSFLPLSPQKHESTVVRPIAAATLTRMSSTATRSTVSTRYRRARRTDALARLEGKASHWEGRLSWQPSHSRKNSLRGNFMSMSDDEADPDDIENSFFDLGYDPTSPINPFDSHIRSQSSPAVPTSPTEASGWLNSPNSPTFSGINLPSIASLSRSPSSKRRRSKTVSLLPGLTSFIDLEKENAENRSKQPWRGMSFIEISSL